jgi:F0F1-type ATP synthase assembly protein I
MRSFSTPMGPSSQGLAAVESKSRETFGFTILVDLMAGIVAGRLLSILLAPPA